jgi:glycosyltransferase involved in cell wall biosynthesis
LAAQVSTPLTQIPIGSNIEAYSPNHIEIAEAREQLHMTDSDCLIGYFGFLNESKGADALLHALSGLESNFHLVFIGGQTGASDPTNVHYMQHMKSIVVELGLTDRVHWTGFLSDKRVSTYLHAADMLAMPYRDGASLRRGTLMAALAHGRPLITTTPADPTPEIQHGENAWLVPVNDTTALEKAIMVLASDPLLRDSLGGKATDTARLFSWEHIATETADFFAQIKETP